MVLLARPACDEFHESRPLEKAFRTRRFMSKFLGISLLSSASQKGRTWEHGPGTLCKLL